MEDKEEKCYPQLRCCHSSGATCHELSPELERTQAPVEKISGNWLCPVAPQTLQFQGWVGCVDVACAACCARLTYCLFGTSGLGPQTVPLCFHGLAECVLSP